MSKNGGCDSDRDGGDRSNISDDGLAIIEGVDITQPQ